MNREQGPGVGESLEDMKLVFEREIRNSLSPTWAKSTQELLPGYLPNKSRGTYTDEELTLYRLAYSFLGELVKSGEVEVIFEDEEVEPPADIAVENQTTSTPRFKLVTNGGKKSEDPSFSMRARPVMENGGTTS